MFSNWDNNWMSSPDFLRKLWPLVLLDLVLKAFALWRSARRGEKWWFVALILVNSLGIIPAFYLLTHRTQEVEESSSESSAKKPKKRSVRKK